MGLLDYHHTVCNIHRQLGFLDNLPYCVWTSFLEVPLSDNGFRLPCHRAGRSVGRSVQHLTSRILPSLLNFCPSLPLSLSPSAPPSPLVPLPDQDWDDSQKWSAIQFIFIPYPWSSLSNPDIDKQNHLLSLNLATWSWWIMDSLLEENP